MAQVTFPVELGGDGSTVSDDTNIETGLAAGGHRDRFVPALAQTVAMASSAKDSASKAKSSEIASGVNAQGAAASESKAKVSELAAGSHKQIAIGKAGEAAASAAAAEQSKSDAVAVVTGGTASLSPSPGKIPIANAKGEIDLRWLGESNAARIMLSAVRVNDVGQPGTLGYGVGICPEVPAGYTALPGTFTLGSDEYGNYKYSDGSIMVWIPAFYYRVGHPDNPTYATHGVNSVHTEPLSAFPDVAAANAAGYALERAFIDGGELVPGFMHDKYRCSNNGGTASSIKNGNPLSSAADHNPFSGLIGAPANNYGGAIAAAKTRGAQFFPNSRFMRAALARLHDAHAQASTSISHNAWWDVNGVTNFVKGNNNNALGDTNDGSVSYVSDGYINCGKTGSGIPFAKTTHNGQNCGIADLNGNMYSIELGLTCVASSASITGATQANPVALTIAGHGITTGQQLMVASIDGMTELNSRIFTVTVVDANTVTLDGVDGTGFTAYTGGGSATFGQFHVASEAARMEDFTGGNTLATDHWGATGVAAMMQPIDLKLRTDYPNSGFTQRYGNAAEQVLSEAVAGDDWLRTGLGMPLPLGVSSSGTSRFGNDYFYQYIRNELCVMTGMGWSNGSLAGPWSAALDSSRARASSNAGFAAASYPVRPSS